ncbi:MAG: hypothetical protein IIU46_02170, partial [Treponema sp.]|nr:hypothetical protein [Treponema sp.]
PAEGLPIMETTPDFLLTVDDSSLFIANIIEKKLRFCYRSFLRGKSSLRSGLAPLTTQKLPSSISGNKQ